MSDYKPISELSALQTSVGLNDLVLISRSIDSSSNGYTSNRACVKDFINVLSTAIEEPLCAVITGKLKSLAYKNPTELNDCEDITAYVKKNTGVARASGVAAISAIHWTEGIIDEIETVQLDDVKAKLTDINCNGTPIAKIDGTQLYNGLSVDQTTTSGFEIAKVNGTSIYGGLDDITLQGLSQKGNDIIKVVRTSPSGTVTETMKNGIEIVPTAAQGSNSQTGQEIFKVNDTPVFNNLSVTSLTSTTNAISQPIADINGTKIYNGVVLNNMTTIGQTIATLNGIQIKNGVNIDPSEYKTKISINAGLNGNIIATVDGKSLKNGVNVDPTYDKSNGVKIANIAGTDIYAPGTDITPTMTSGIQIATVTTANGITKILYAPSQDKLSAEAYYTSGTKIASVQGIDIYSPKDSQNVTITSTWHDDTTRGWYRIWSDGWCEQGGYVATTAGNKKVNTINLHRSYANTRYSINISRANPTGCGTPQGAANIVKDSAKVNSFQVMSVCGTTHTAIYWETKGYVS